jgi:fructose-bisphosphate aldolase, class I
MNIGKKIRLNRVFSHPSGRRCSVAADHFVGYGRWTSGGGLSKLPAALKKIVAGMPGVVTMSKGTAMNCWEAYAGKVPLILPAGCFTADDRVIEAMTNPEECVRLGADAIAVAIGIFGPGEGKFLRRRDLRWRQQRNTICIPWRCSSHPGPASDFLLLTVTQRKVNLCNIPL